MVLQSCGMPYAYRVNIKKDISEKSTNMKETLRIEITKNSP